MHRRAGIRLTASAVPAGALLVPAEECEGEIKVKNSRFIGTSLHSLSFLSERVTCQMTRVLFSNTTPAGSLGHTPTVESAREYIGNVKSRFPDARHHCYAFSIGHGASVTQGMSDDGEPSGTAGRPILAVLGGSNLGDCTLVVTRYFGG